MERHEVKQLDFVKVQDKPFTGRIICGECGSAFGRKTWNSTDEVKRYRTEEFIGIIGKSQGIEEFDVDLYFRITISLLLLIILLTRI